jgi:hypothetical protein
MFDTSASSGKQGRAISMSRAHLLALVGDMLGGGKGLAGGRREKSDFLGGHSGLVAVGFMAGAAMAGNGVARMGAVGGKHWPMCAAKIWHQRVARARILCPATCLRDTSQTYL